MNQGFERHTRTRRTVSYSLRAAVAVLGLLGACAMLVPLVSSAAGHASTPLGMRRETGGKAAVHGRLTAIAHFDATGARQVAAGSSGNPPSPPFRECPAIGADQSCGILIYVTNAGTQVLLDPSQGPYDGGDDTLVGILNRSGRALSSVSLSSNTNIFGFDGDGICGYSNWTGDEKCPYGPTGYEGPGTHYPVTGGNSGPVVFAPKLAANGGSAYLGLEEALSSASLVNTKAYAALGDSYSAGVGTENSQWSSTCDRGPGAWPKLLSDLAGLTFTGDPKSPAKSFFACSGAKSTQELHGDPSTNQPNQVYELEQYATNNATPGIVTITAGGNDVGFAGLLTACRLNVGACLFELGGGLRYLTKGAKPFEENLAKLYEGAAKAAGHGTRVEAVGYPRIFPTKINWLRLNLHCKWLASVPGAIGLISQLTSDLDNDIHQAANKAHVSYAATDNAVSGHELCTGESWIASLDLINAIKHIAGHPLPKGQEAMAKAVLADLQSSGGPLAAIRTSRQSKGRVGTQQLSTPLSEGALSMSVAELPGATLGDPYLGFFAASGGSEPYAWSVTKGALPAGLSLDSGTGVVSGTPTSMGTSKLTITATDSASPAASVSKAFSLTVGSKTPLSVSTKALPSGTAGQQYEATLATSGGTEPVRWSIETGSLPAGLSLDAETGTIEGTPAAAGQSKVTFRASDSTEPSQSATTTVALNVVPAGEQLALGAVSAPSGKAGEYYGLALSSTGGTAPITWSVTAGALPSGLAVDPNSGQIAGVPTESGSFPVTVTATDRSTPTAQSASAETTIVIAAASHMSLLTATVPSTTQGSAYVTTLNAEGGIGPYSWQLTSGTLPPGLTLESSTGTIEGTPTESGSFTFTASAFDGSMPTAQSVGSSYTISVSASSPVFTFAPPEATVNVAYSYTPEPGGGVEPYRWTIQSGELPAGLSLDETTGTISGTPTASGASTVTLALSDSSQPAAQSVSASATLTVGSAPPLQLESAGLPEAANGVPYRAVVFTSGGTEPLTFSITHGALPAGVSLDWASGVLSGTPQVEGEYPVTIQVTDSSHPTQTRSAALTLKVLAPPPLTIETSSLPEAGAGSAYAQSLIAVGGSEPYTWSIQSGTLPAGLTLSPSTGAISGTPTEAGTFSFEAKVTDSSSTAKSGTVALTLTVSATSPLSIRTSSLPEGTQGSYYDVVVEADGGVPPREWSVSSGSLPEGLTLDPQSGTIYGVPTSFASSSFTLRVSDSSSPTSQVATRKLSLKIAPAPPFSVGATSLAPGTQGQYYNQPLEVSGGVAPYTVSVSSGSLPEGLSVDQYGNVYGEITSEHSQTFTLTIHDGSTPHQQSVSRQYTIEVTPAPALMLSSTTMPYVLGQYSGQSLGASGGVPGYNWALVSGKLPAGLSFSGGYIYGTPSKAGKATISVTLTDSATPSAHSVTKSITLKVVKPAKLKILTGKLPAAKVGTYYQQAVAVAGGSPPYSWTLSAGALPPGLFQSGEYIYGTPETPGSYSFTVKVTDSGSPSAQTATKTFTLKVS